MLQIVQDHKIYGSNIHKNKNTLHETDFYDFYLYKSVYNCIFFLTTIEKHNFIIFLQVDRVSFFYTLPRLTNNKNWS